MIKPQSADRQVGKGMSETLGNYYKKKENYNKRGFNESRYVGAVLEIANHKSVDRIVY